ncbi:MAG: orotidine-5'-phosphate decarboxylase [Patescibacteria group bacterium]
MHNPILVALDGFTDEAKLLAIAEKLGPHVAGFKLNDALDVHGVGIIHKLYKHTNWIMADPKLYDIPNTMKNRALPYVQAGARMLTVHASATIDGMHAAVEVGRSQKLQTLVLAVTVLTSMSEEEAHLMFGNPSKAEVLQLARNAKLADADGIVCSPLELPLLKQRFELKGLLYVVPGIRPAWHQKADDQKRTMTPAEARKAGADYIVIGRPILEHADPVVAANLTLEEWQAAA